MILTKAMLVVNLYINKKRNKHLNTTCLAYWMSLEIQNVKADVVDKIK